MYRFSTDDIVAEKGDHKTAVNALDMINVVPIRIMLFPLTKHHSLITE